MLGYLKSILVALGKWPPPNSTAVLTSSKKALDVINNFFSKDSTGRFWANTENMSAKNVPTKTSVKLSIM